MPNLKDTLSRRIFKWFLPVAAFFMLAPAAWADGAVSLSADRQEVGVNDAFSLTVTLSGDAEDAQPRVDGLERFDLLGTSTGTQIRIVNLSMEKLKTITYTLRPKAAGETVTLQAFATVDGKILQSKTVTVKTVQQSAQPPAGAQRQQGWPGAFPDDQFFNFGRRTYGKDHFMLQARVSDPVVYPGQEIVYTLSFYAASSPYGNPQVTFPDTKGFWREEIPKEENFRHHNEMVSGTPYSVAEVSLLLYPLTDGQLEIPEGSLELRPDPFSNPIKLHSNTVPVTVRPLPQEGRPAEFRGLVGDFSLAATIKKDDYRTGKAITLEVTLSGHGNLQSAEAPQAPDFSGFEDYDPETEDHFKRTHKGLSGSRVFRYILIPRRAGQLTIESFPLAWFNPEDGQYHTARTEPITITVSGGGAATTTAPVAGQTDGPLPDIRTGLSDLADHGTPFYLTPSFWALLLILPALTAAGAWARSRALARQAAEEERTRQKDYRLEQARKLMHKDDADGFYRELGRVVWETAAGWRNENPDAADRPRIITALKESDKEHEAKAAALLEECDTIRFGPVSAGREQMETMYRTARELLEVDA